MVVPRWLLDPLKVPFAACPLCDVSVNYLSTMCIDLFFIPSLSRFARAYSSFCLLIPPSPRSFLSCFLPLPHCPSLPPSIVTSSVFPFSFPRLYFSYRKQKKEKDGRSKARYLAERCHSQVTHRFPLLYACRTMMIYNARYAPLTSIPVFRTTRPLYK